MRHSRGTNLTRNGFLSEIAKRDVTPDITAEIYDDGVKTGGCIKQFRHVVMGFNLNGIGFGSGREK